MYEQRKPHRRLFKCAEAAATQIIVDSAQFEQQVLAATRYVLRATVLNLLHRAHTRTERRDRVHSVQINIVKSSSVKINHPFMRREDVLAGSVYDKNCITHACSVCTVCINARIGERIYFCA